MRIYRLPVLRDNYIFLIHDPNSKVTAVVDPAEAQPVLDCLNELKSELVAILNTHHHADHVGGNAQLLDRFPHAVVYGGAHDKGRIPGQQVFLQEGDRITVAERQAEILFVPGHTRAHIAYYFPPEPSDLLEISGVGELFCGDTLFAGGCGRLFEGTPSQMLSSLDKLRSLPDNTHVWCAHEYTLKNLQFALTVDTRNSALLQRAKAVEAMRDRAESTVPSKLGVEKLTNPFLRWDQPALQSATHTHDPVKTFARLRGMKDRF